MEKWAEIANTAGGVIADYAVMIITTPQNAPILVAAWWLVERTDGLISWWIASPRYTKTQRVRLRGLADWGKQGAAAFWCLLLAMVPGAQQPICAAADTPDCHTWVERIAAPIAMGLALSGLHKVIAFGYRKLGGKPRLRRIVCANCRKPAELRELNQPCPNCGQPPHEVTSRG